MEGKPFITLFAPIVVAAALLIPVKGVWGQVPAGMDSVGAVVDSTELEEESQYWFDAATVNVGVTAFRGDLDNNPDGNMLRAFLRSGMDLSVRAERMWDVSFLAVGMGYSHVQSDHSQYGFSNQVFRLEAQAGVGLDWIRPHMFRVFSGLGFLRHKPTHTNPTAVRTTYATRPVEDGLWAISVPMGVTINKRINIIGRLVLSDYLDNAEGDKQPFDFITHVNVGYRISL